MRLLRQLARIWTVLLGCTAAALTLGLAARVLVPLTPTAEAPALASVSPADGARDVLPRSPITLTFSEPMNRQSTLAALSISPPTPGDFAWSADARTLTFRPEPALTADVTYTISLDSAALSRWWRPLASPRQVSFRTAPLPDVVAALPNGPDAPRDTSIAVVFSQPMVPAERVGAPAQLPELSFEPPLAADLRWVDQQTLLVRPAAPLRAATIYSATIAGALTDLRGVELGQPYRWSFATAWPAVVERSPASGERWASPRQPLVLTLDAPVDAALLGQALTIDPPVEGDLSSAALASTQVITFTPRGGWEPGRSYSVGLASPPGLGSPPELGWRFTVGPPPGLIAFFPGQGQELPPGQAVRLIFSTPMDEAALRQGISIEPPVAELPITVADAEVRLRPELAPSTLYTITVAAGTPDRRGEPLADAATVRIRTGPAEPALRAPAAPGGLVTIPLSATAAVELERVNLDRLDLALYRLDTPTLLLALAFGPSDWRDFRPERYGQILTRAWRLDLSDPPDRPASDPIAIGPADGSPLDPGAYYLRAISPEGPRADLLVLVSSLRLALRQGESQALVWATDASSGAAVAGVPVALYAGDALINRGITGPDGVWEQPIQRGPQDPPYLAVAEGDQPALVSAAWAADAALAEPRLRALLLLDDLDYLPGAVVRLGGQARRRTADGGLALPAPATACRLQLLADGAPLPAPPLSAECRVGADGRVSGTVRLDPRTAPGAYTLRAQVGDGQTLLPLRVTPLSNEASLTIERRDGAGLALAARAGGLPLSGATITYSLRLEPLGTPAAADGYRLAAPAVAPVLQGTLSTDDEGRAIVPLPAAESLGAGVRYRLAAELGGGEQRAGLADAGTLTPPGPLVGLRLPARVITTDERARIELLALDEAGGPVAGAELTVEVFRGAEAGDGAPLLVRRARSGPDGAAGAELVTLNPGRYTVVARAGGSAAQTELWVAGRRYIGWPDTPGRVELIADREVYRPGDTARLLVAAPTPAAELLLTVESGDLLSHELRTLRAGELITLTITPEMAPGVRVGALLATAEGRRSGDTALRVLGDAAPLSVAVAAGQADYLPGASAPISVTVSDDGGPLAADLVLMIAPDAALPAGEPPPPPGLGPGLPPPLATALAPPSGPASAPQGPAAAEIAPPGYLVPVSGGAGGAGTTVAQATLPDRPGRWRVVAYALVGAERVATGSAVITTAVPLELEALAPPALRPGDEASAELLVRNSSTVSRTLRATLVPEGLSLAAGQPAAQQLLLAPNAELRLRWAVRGGAAPGAGVLRFGVTGDGLDERLERGVALIPPAAPAATRGATLVGAGDLRAELSAADPAGEITVALAPSLRAALASTADALAARPERDVEGRASLLLISAGLARDPAAPERERWRGLAAEAWEELAAAQNTDGGWGWWPGAPSDPFVTALGLEAQAAGRQGLGGAYEPSGRAISYLERARAGAAPALQAYVGYALSRAGRADGAATAALLGADLSPDGLAFLALSLPPGQAGPTLDRLAALAAPAPPPGFPWHARDDAPMPRTPLAVSAAAAQAFSSLRPAEASLPAVERSLRLAWGVDGWPSPYEAARVAAALLPAAGPEPPAPRRLLLGANPLSSGPISATVRLDLPPGSVTPGAALVVEAPARSDYLLAYRAAATPAPASGGQPLIETRLLDAESGAPLAPDALQVGREVIVEVALISPRPLLRADLSIELPAALAPLALTAPAGFSRQQLDADSLRASLGAASMPAGVYSARVLARVAATGEFVAPAPRLSVPFGIGGAQGPLTIAGREPLLLRASP